VSLPDPGSKRLSHIQTLRAIAALLVVVAHVTREVSAHAAVSDRLAGQLRLGDFGVDLFFIISGFIMYWIAGRSAAGPQAAGAFLAKRAVRVVPMYWLFTGLFIAPALLLPGAVNHSGLTLQYVLASLTFVPAARPGSDVVQPALGLGWTLDYEMMFYCIFAVILLFRVRSVLVAATVALLTLATIGLVVPREWVAPWYWTRSIILEFWLGCCIAFAADRRWCLPSGVGIVLLVLAVCSWQATGLLGLGEPGSGIRGLVWGVPAGLAVGAVALTPLIRSFFSSGSARNPMQRLGDASYSLYLSHMFFVRIATGLFRHLPAWLFGLGAIILPVVGALVVYQLVERPLLTLGMRWIDRSRFATGRAA